MDLFIEQKVLQFKQPSGTSRGILHTKPSWILRVPLLNGMTAQGECSVIPGLSPDFIDVPQYEKVLSQLQVRIRAHWRMDEWLQKSIFQSEKWRHFTLEYRSYPSILFGLETLVLDIQAGGSGILFDTAFTRKETTIPINGLIWMGDESFMLRQMEEKLADGFTTIKMKVGAIEWEKELALLTMLRRRFSSKDLTLRVDANGAFLADSAKPILAQLAELEVHSIEQPIAARQTQAMRKLCAESPVGIALDEELIGVDQEQDKSELLETIAPPFIVLKPSLHGGIQGCREWIRLAEERQISWWMTSALESSIGLNAIAQFTSLFENQLPQGLGTGGLYTNNFESLLVVEKGQLMMK